MPRTDYRTLTREELDHRLTEAQEELFRLRMRAGVMRLDNPLHLRTLKRDIARMKTILLEDERGMRALARSGGGQAEQDRKRGHDEQPA
jgi:large subunit ribosomal protein L29